MFWNAKNASVMVGSTKMHYVSFGKGKQPLILLPGLSDGLATVRGKAILLAYPYRRFFDAYTVYMFSRKDDMPEGYSIRDMALDQAEAMDQLKIRDACVAGVSQGGMIAQYLASERPDLVRRLVLAVTAASLNDQTRECVETWILYAQKNRHRELMIDTAEKSYSENYLRKYRKIYPLIGWIGRPRSYKRFLRNADAILGFDATNEIGKISCPTLIIGAEQDRIVGVQGSYDLKEMIKGSELFIYPGLGHAAFEEAEDFNRRIGDFFDRND